ncbi:MAG TPA: YciI family protein [Kofleriaceae bacterium]|jgi:hypothetical protein|nr:YciI family protein [Kofleriaceae bacterium]
MKYLLMIYDNEIARHALPPDQKAVLHAGYIDLVKSLGAAYVGGAPLQPTKTAKSVRVREGKTQITDGPFAETREQLGGYFLIEASSYDEATKIAARMPGAEAGTIEIRPLADMPTPTP